MTSNSTRTAGAYTLINPSKKGPDTALSHRSEVWIHPTSQTKEDQLLYILQLPTILPLLSFSDLLPFSLKTFFPHPLH